MEHRNRDYFTKPIQHSRNVPDYGNTKLERENVGSLSDFLAGMAACCGLLVLLFVFAVMTP